MYPYILDSFTGKTLFQLNKYYNLNLLNELFGVIIPHGFDMGNIGLIDTAENQKKHIPIIMLRYLEKVKS